MKILGDRRQYFFCEWNYTFALVLVAALQKNMGIKENREFLNCVMERCQTAFPHLTRFRPVATDTQLQLLCELTCGLRTFRLDKVALPLLCRQIPLWRRVEIACSRQRSVDNVDNALAARLFHCFLVDCCMLIYQMGVTVTEPIVQSIVESSLGNSDTNHLRCKLTHYDSFYALVPRVRESCLAIIDARKVSCQPPWKEKKRKLRARTRRPPPP